MKPSLADFPITAPYSRDQLKFADSYIEEIQKWKANFEKRLSEMRDITLIAMDSDYDGPLKERRLYRYKGMYEVIKEILGE